QQYYALVSLLVEEQLFAPRPTSRNVNGRIDALLGQTPVEPQLPVAGTLELLEDHLVHAAPGVHEAGRDDRQATAVFHVPRGPEQALGRVQRNRIDAAGERPARRREGQVIGARHGADPAEHGHDV